MNRVNILCIVIGLFLFYSCELDNYDPPTMTLEGKVVDEVTGENLFTSQPNGIKVRLLEEGFTTPTPFDFWAMSDGTFKNTKLFSAKYKLLILEGAFEDASVEQIDLDLTTGNKVVEFKVMPYIRLKNVAISVSGTTVKANYKLESTSTKAPKSSLLILYNSVHLHITTQGVKKSATNDLTKIAPLDLPNKTFEDQITALTPGKYYARVAVLTNNPLNRYSYSQIVEVTVQ